MKNFDEKWQACAARARTAERRDEAAPFGFAARVAARALSTPPELELVREGMMLRWLVGAVAALALCAALELPHWRGSPSLESGVENTVAQLVWAL